MIPNALCMEPMGACDSMISASLTSSYELNRGEPRNHGFVRWHSHWRDMWSGTVATWFSVHERVCTRAQG